VLVPVIAGSGKGLTQVLIGIGLIAASFLIPGAAAIGTFGLTKAIAVKGLVAGIGATLALGGAAQLLSPQPQVPTLSGNRFGSGTNASTRGPQSETRGADGQQSYAYTGAANTVGMGAVVPVAYGKVLVGSQLLSANVEVTDESDPLSTAIKTPSFDTIRIGGEPVGYGYSDVSGIQTRRTDETSFNRANQYNLYYNLGLANGNETKYTFDTKNDSRNNFAVCLGLPVGIRDRVSGAGSSLVDGFITYRVTVTRGKTQDVLGSIQATIQGLAFGHYRWVHRFSHANNDKDDGTVRVEIIDFRCEGDVYLQLQAAGYNF
jgi:predicted phage tail protein